MPRLPVSGSEATHRRTAPDRIEELDSLRGIAAMAVVVNHYTHWGPYVARRVPYFWWGLQGVDLFFVISGFVILMTASHGTLRDFVISRASRLFPGYWFCALFSYLLLRLHDGISIPLN